MNSTIKSITTLIIITLCSCNNNSTDYLELDTPTYEETKLSLEDQELQNPLSFLSTDGKYHQNLVGKWVINGTVHNSATVATYKDVVLTFKFYSKTQTLLGTEDYPIYEFFRPGDNHRFKVKLYGFNGTRKVDWEIKTAQPQR